MQSQKLFYKRLALSFKLLWILNYLVVKIGYINHEKTNTCFLISLIVLLTTASLALAEKAKQVTDIIGKKEFVTYCGSCHGTNGKGDRPIVHFLERKPPNLTLLSKNNGGVYAFGVYLMVPIFLQNMVQVKCRFGVIDLYKKHNNRMSQTFPPKPGLKH